jgi:hypothetical protein
MGCSTAIQRLNSNVPPPLRIVGVKRVAHHKTSQTTRRQVKALAFRGGCALPDAGWYALQMIL